MEVDEKPHLLLDEDRVRDARSSRARDAPDAMDEEFGAGWEVEVDDVIQERDVDASRGDVRDDEYRGFSRAKLSDVELPRGEIHAAVHRRARHPLRLEHGHEELDVVPGGGEHHRLLLVRHNLAEDVEQRGDLRRRASW